MQQERTIFLHYRLRLPCKCVLKVVVASLNAAGTNYFFALQMKKYMRDNHPTVAHWFDVWHVAKGM